VSLIDWAIRRLTAKSAVSGTVFWILFGPVFLYVAFGIWGIAEEAQQEWSRFALGFLSSALQREIRADSLEFDAERGVLRIEGLYVGDPTSPEGVPFVEHGSLRAELVPARELLALAGSPASIPKKVILSGARVAIRRDADGTWNFKAGMKPGPPRAIEGLGFPLLFADCDVVYDDAVVKKAMRSQVPIEGKSAKGFLYFGESRGHLQVEARRPAGGSMSVSCWFDYPEPNYAVRVWANREDASIAQGLAQHIGLEGLSGSLSFDLEVSKVSQTAPLHFECVSHVADGECRHRFLPGPATRVNWDGRFDLTGASGSGSANLAGSPLEFGLVVSGYSDPRVEARIKSAALSARTVQTLLSDYAPAHTTAAGLPTLQEAAEAEATLAWTAETGPALYGSARVPALAVGAHKASEIRCSFDYASGSLAVTELGFEFAQGKVSGAAAAEFGDRGPDVRFVGNVSQAELSELSPLLDEPGPVGAESQRTDYAGRCDAVVTAHYSAGELDLAAALSAQGALIAGYGLDAIRADAEYHNGLVTLTGFAQDPNGGAAWAEGTYSSDAGARFDITIANLDLAAASQLGLPPDLEGKAWLSGSLSGTQQDPAFSGECALFGVGTRDLKATAVRGSFDFRRDIATIREMTAYMAGGQVALSGRVSELESGNPQVALDAKIDHVALQGLGIDVVDRAGASGVVSGRLHSEGPVSDAAINLDAQVAGATAYSYPLGAIEVAASYGEGLLEIQKASAEFMTQRIDISGSLRVGQQVSLSVDCSDLMADALTGFADALSGLTGTFDAHADISGPVNSPSADVSFASTGLAFAGQPLGATIGTVSVKDGIVWGREFVSQLDDQTVRIDSLRYDSATKDSEFSAQASEFELATLVAMARSAEGRSVLPAPVIAAAGRLRGSASGVFSSELDLHSAGGKLSGSIHASGDRLTLGDRRLGEFDAAMTLKDNALEIEELRLAGDHGTLTGHGSVDPDKLSDIRLVGTRIDMPFVGEWLAPSIPVDSGVADFDLRIFGPPNARALQGGFVVSELSIPPLPFDRVDCSDISAAGGRLSASNMVVSGGGAEVVVQADLPFDTSGFFVPPNEPMSVRGKLDLQASDKDTAAGEAPEQVPTRFAGDFEVSGTPRTPKLAGHVSIRSASLTVPHMTVPAENVSVELDIADGRAELSGLEAHLGEGTVKAKGSIDLNGLVPEGMAFQVSADRARLGIDNASDWYREKFEGDVTGEFALAGIEGQGGLRSLLSPKVSGSAKVTRATVSIPAPPSKPRPARPTPKFDPSFDISVESGEPVHVRLPNARVDTTASFVIRGSFSSPEIAGEMQAERGQMYYVGNRFALQSGDVRVSYAPPVFIASVSASAEARLPGVRITVDISGVWGPYSNLSVSLTSSPPMSESEILASLGHGSDIERILGGRTLDAFWGQETWKLLASAFQPGLLMPFEDVLTQALGLESISLGLGFGGQSYVSLEKQIFKGLFLGYTKALTGAEAEETIRLFWRFNKYSEVYWSQDPEWGQRIGLTGRWRF
jgi:hypothetical protein